FRRYSFAVSNGPRPATPTTRRRPTSKVPAIANDLPRPLSRPPAGSFLTGGRGQRTLNLRRNRHARGLHPSSAENHQTLLQQPGDAAASTAGGAGERIVPGPGQEAPACLGSRRLGHAEARPAAITDRALDPAG